MFGLNLNDPYIFSTLIMSIVVLVIGVYLLFYKVSATTKLKHYRISCRLMSLSFFLVAVFSFISLIPFTNTKEQSIQIQTDLALSYTLVIASFQAFVGIFALIILLNPNFLTKPKILKHLLPITLGSSFLIYATFHSPTPLLNNILIGYIILYCAQLVYYAYLFAQEYKNYKLRAANFYADDESHRIRWIKRVLILGFALGIYVLIGVFYDALNNIIFTIVSTIIYIYITIEYLNYPSRFFTQDDNQQMDFDESDPDGQFEFIPELEKWVANKGFVTPGLTLKEVAFTLGTNQLYLSKHINDHYQQNFRIWICNLRMQEAQHLLLKHPNLTIDQVSDRLGIANRSSFHRQFLVTTGETPANFRKQQTVCT